jgi:hypothetical protein
MGAMMAKAAENVAKATSTAIGRTLVIHHGRGVKRRW